MRAGAESDTDYSSTVGGLVGSSGCFAGPSMETGLVLDCNRENWTPADLLL